MTSSFNQTKKRKVLIGNLVLKHKYDEDFNSRNIKMMVNRFEGEHHKIKTISDSEYEHENTVRVSYR